MTSGAVAALAALSFVNPAQAAEFFPPPQDNNATTTQQMNVKDDKTIDFNTLEAPPVSSSDFQYPEGSQWRYSEFLRGIQAGNF